MTTGYIYVVKNEVGGMGGYKIGKTINPQRRFRELKIGTKASLVGLWSSERYSSIEKLLHKKFAEYRVPQSEWFALASDKLQDLITRLNNSACLVKLSANYGPATPVVIPKPVTNVYTGPNPEWFDYSKPVVRTPVSSKPSKPRVDTPVGDFIAAFFLGFIPVIGQVALLASVINEKTRGTAFAWGVGIGTLALIIAHTQ